MLAFLPAGPGIEEHLSLLEATWPKSLRLGCESSHQFADDERRSSGCLLLCWLEVEDHNIRAEVVEAEEGGILPEDPVVDRAVRALSSAESLLLLCDGLRFPIDWLLGELRRRFASALPSTIGALASKPLSSGAGARVFLGAKLYPSACLLIGLEGVSVDTHMAHDWEPASPVYTVSAAQGKELYEIDGEPAVEWYHRFFTVDGELAPMPETAFSFPLIIEGPDPARRGLYRSLRAFDQPPGGATFWADVHEGDQIRLAIRSPRARGWSAGELAASRDGAEAALLFSCIGRTQTLGGDVSSDFGLVREALGEVSLAGFDSFGEIAGPPQSPSGDGVAHHNQTAVVGLLRERRG